MLECTLEIKKRGLNVIKFVFFDLDDTLFDFKMAEKIAIKFTLSKFGIDPTDDTVALYSRINLSCWEKLERGEYTREEVLNNRFKFLFEALGVDAPFSEARKTYEERLGIGHYFLPGAEELLENIKGKYEMYITSNGIAKVQAGRIASSGIEKYFNEIFVSEKVGANKPSPIFFERVFERIDGFDKAEAIIIGDSLTSDILGGINAGIKTCWFNPKYKQNNMDFRADYEVDSLDKIPGLLESI